MAKVIETHVAQFTDVIERELDRARRELRPISRRYLRELLVKVAGIAPKDAETAVDTYCEERAPYTPDYLGSEFLLPYIKVASLFFVVISLAAIGWGAHLFLDHRSSWPFFLAGGALFAVSGMGLLKVLRTEREAD